MTEPATGGVSARADLAGGIVWVAIGLAIVAAALAMDRFEAFGASVHTMPGLVPGILGVTLAGLGLLLLVRAIRAGAIAELAATWLPSAEGRSSMRRASIATALALVYTLAMVGHVWFPVATALFVFAFIMVFDVSPDQPRPLGRRAVIAGVTALATAASVAFVFEQIFLVRLP
jgi:putative tricarboxylic transport membrane protein